MTADADVTRIQTALAHGVTGQPQRAYKELQPLIDKGPGGMYVTLCCLAEVAVSDQKPGAGEFLGLQVERNGSPADASDAAPALRFAMQFMAAQANHDDRMTVALFQAAFNETPLALADALRIVFDAAVATSRAQIARTKSA